MEEVIKQEHYPVCFRHKKRQMIENSLISDRGSLEQAKLNSHIIKKIINASSHMAGISPSSH